MFKPIAGGHGGSHRSAQLCEILLENGHEIVDLTADPASLSPSRLMFIDIARDIWTSFSVRWWALLRGYSFSEAISTVRSWVYACRSYEDVMRPHCGRSVLLWEDSRDFLPLLAARRLGIPVVAVPQNIESLVRGQRFFLAEFSALDAFSLESKMISMASCVFTISREEQWLLAHQGIEAHYLPYVPVSETRNELMEVRRRREKAELSDTILVLGTVNNPPTRRGIERLARSYNEWHERVKLGDLVIVGYGADALRDDDAFRSPGIQIAGHASTEQLSLLMSQARCAIVYQPDGTGALTRIPELLLAGVPTLCNPIAARSAFDQDIIIYEDIDDVWRLVLCEMRPPRPPPSVDLFAQRFVEAISTSTCDRKYSLERRK